MSESCAMQELAYFRPMWADAPDWAQWVAGDAEDAGDCYWHKEEPDYRMGEYVSRKMEYAGSFPGFAGRVESRQDGEQR